MKGVGIITAAIGVALAAIVALQLLPAEAQESSVAEAWDLTVVSYSSGDKPRLAVVKHNDITGQTLILTCDNRCDADEVWRDFDAAEPR